jgi:hypothetical protein
MSACGFVPYRYIRSFDGFWSYIIACQTARCNDSPLVNPEASPTLVDKLIAQRVSSSHTYVDFFIVVGLVCPWYLQESILTCILMS